MTGITYTEALTIYESARARLPYPQKVGACEHAETLEEIADEFDVFLLDAFGVLNIGETAISGVSERIDRLRAIGKRVLVLTNAAGLPSETLHGKYAKLGFSFEPDEIVSSRAVLFEALAAEPVRRWGVIAAGSREAQGLDPSCMTLLEDDPAPYETVDGFMFLGTAEWTESRQRNLEAAVERRPRSVWVGNPDVVAPRETGFSTEPGLFAHRLADKTGVEPRFFGKPFENIFDVALSRMGFAFDRSRAVMVGDSLHTDILGARAAGVASALVTKFGFFAGVSAADAIARTGIAPDYILDRP